MRRCSFNFMCLPSRSYLPRLDLALPKSAHPERLWCCVDKRPSSLGVFGVSWLWSWKLVDQVLSTCWVRASRTSKKALCIQSWSKFFKIAGIGQNELSQLWKFIAPPTRLCKQAAFKAESKQEPRPMPWSHLVQ